MIKKIVERITTSYISSPDSLNWLRRIFCCYLLLSYIPRGLHLKDIPDSLLNPAPGLPQLIAMFDIDRGMWVTVCNLIACILTSLILFGIRVPAASIALTVTLFALNSVTFATGKVDHDIIMTITPALLSMVWGPKALSHASDSAKDSSQNPSLQSYWQLGYLAMFISMLMFTSGLPKFLSGWLDTDSHAVLGHSIKYALVEGRNGFFLEQALKHTPFFMWEVLDWVTILFELSFVVAVFFPSIFYRLLFVAVLFHLGISLKMDLGFDFQVPVYAAFVPWELLLGKAKEVAGGSKKLILALIVAAGVSAVVLIKGYAVVYLGPLSNAPRNTLFIAAPIAIYLAFKLPWAVLACKIFSPTKEKDSEEGVVLFDGICGLCNSTVDHILQYDKTGQFRFSPLQSEYAQKVLPPLGINPEDLSSIVLYQNGKAWTKSTAVFAILGQIKSPWTWSVVLLAIPRFLRDVIYRLVASLRYSLFGKKATCRLPTPEERTRFILE